jgi:2-amino-4-hydroxy-6-hydroxymethyldihydropteridine diphosphokinase
MGNTAYIGLGSNIGEKVCQCEKAVTEILKGDCHRLLAKSSLYRTQPVGYASQDWFVNGAIKIETDLDGHALLRFLKDVETRLGRTKTFRWGPRIIDLDILFFDGREVKTEDLQIPHPLLHRRKFVLIPLVEIDRNLIHPVLKKTVQQLLEDLEEDQVVEKLMGLEQWP